MKALALRMMLAVAASSMASADVTGVYLSQLAADDPLVQAGYAGTEPVYMLVVENAGNQVVATVNTTYSPGNSNLNAKVWSYAIFALNGSQPVTMAINDSFNVCNVSVTVTFGTGSFSVQTVSSRNMPGASNPLGIDCLDLYPLITRTFTKIF